MERKKDETLSPEEQITLFVDSVEEGFRERVNQAIKELAEILMVVQNSSKFFVNFCPICVFCFWIITLLNNR